MSQQDHTRLLYRSVYLITYSRADLTIVESKNDFANLVTGAITRATPARVTHWSVGEEQHLDGSTHFHMAIKLDRQQRWLAIRDRIHMDHGIQVNFSGDHFNYFSAWTYCTKEGDFLESDPHPDLNDNPPRTQNASQAWLVNPPNKRQKVERLSHLDVSLIISGKGIKSYLQLLALAKEQKDQGKFDLLQFILSKGKYRPKECPYVSKNCDILYLCSH